MCFVYCVLLFVIYCFFCCFYPTATCHVLRLSRPSFDVAELTIELSGILPISSLSCIVVAWPPKMAMAVSGTVLRPTL